MKFAILTGYDLDGFGDALESIEINTTYGTINIERYEIHQHTVFIIPRHGTDQMLPPHAINYKGNIEACVACHVDGILSFGTVGSLKEHIQPNDYVVIDDFIDCTKRRSLSFFDKRRIHIDMGQPFCPWLQCLIRNGLQSNVTKGRVHTSGVYLVTEGPRLETKAEVQWYATVADIVGMTLVPEVVLAREKDLCFGSFCLVSNWATGLNNTRKVCDIPTMVMKQKNHICDIIKAILRDITKEKTCNCASMRD